MIVRHSQDLRQSLEDATFGKSLARVEHARFQLTKLLTRPRFRGRDVFTTKTTIDLLLANMDGLGKLPVAGHLDSLIYDALQTAATYRVIRSGQPPTDRQICLGKFLSHLNQLRNEFSLVRLDFDRFGLATGLRKLSQVTQYLKKADSGSLAAQSIEQLLEMPVRNSSDAIVIRGLVAAASADIQLNDLLFRNNFYLLHEIGKRSLDCTLWKSLDVQSNLAWVPPKVIDFFTDAEYLRQVSDLWTRQITSVEADLLVERRIVGRLLSHLQARHGLDIESFCSQLIERRELGYCPSWLGELVSKSLWQPIPSFSQERYIAELLYLSSRNVYGTLDNLCAAQRCWFDPGAGSADGHMMEAEVATVLTRQPGIRVLSISATSHGGKPFVFDYSSVFDGHTKGAKKFGVSRVNRMEVDVVFSKDDKLYFAEVKKTLGGFVTKNYEAIEQSRTPQLSRLMLLARKFDAIPLVIVCDGERLVMQSRLKEIYQHAFDSSGTYPEVWRYHKSEDGGTFEPDKILKN